MKAQLWFYQGKGRFTDKLIRLWTRSRYSHVEIVVSGIAYAADAWEGCVRTKPAIQFNWANWDVVEVELEKDIAWLDAQKGKKYDWLGILGYISFGMENPKKWYCSELAAAALGMKKRKVSPGDLYNQITKIKEKQK